MTTRATAARLAALTAAAALAAGSDAWAPVVRGHGDSDLRGQIDPVVQLPSKLRAAP
jgi:hypothetical protein